VSKKTKKPIKPKKPNREKKPIKLIRILKKKQPVRIGFGFISLKLKKPNRTETEKTKPN